MKRTFARIIYYGFCMCIVLGLATMVIGIAYKGFVCIRDDCKHFLKAAILLLILGSPIVGLAFLINWADRNK